MNPYVLSSQDVARRNLAVAQGNLLRRLSDPNDSPVWFVFDRIEAEEEVKKCHRILERLGKA
jgi:hypothetical protein